MLKQFENVRFVRMADGKTFKLIRDLGLVKGGKGLRCHEPILTVQLKLKPISFHIPVLEVLSLFARPARAHDRSPPRMFSWS